MDRKVGYAQSKRFWNPEHGMRCSSFITLPGEVTIFTSPFCSLTFDLTDEERKVEGLRHMH